MKFETWVKQQIAANKKQIKSYQTEIKTLKEEVKRLDKHIKVFKQLNREIEEPVTSSTYESNVSQHQLKSSYIEQLEKRKIPTLKAQNETLATLAKRKLAKVDGLLIHYGVLLEYAKKLNASRLQVTASTRNNELQLHYSGKQGTNGLLSLFDITAQLTDAPNDLTYDTYTLEDVQCLFKS